MKTHTQPPAFVVLFAALATVLMLTIGAGIFSIATKEALLSGSAREAQYSFTAADTGMECALLAQQQGLLTVGGTITCADNAVQIIPSGNPGQFEMRLQTSPTVNGVSTCAYVSVVTVAPLRSIVSQGYNLCNNDTPQLNNPRVSERDLQTTFSVGGGSSQQGTGGGNQIQSVQGGGNNNQSILQQANVQSQQVASYQSLLDQLTQAQARIGNIPPDDGGDQKILTTDTTGTVQTTANECPVGYTRQSASAQTSMSLLNTGSVTSDPKDTLATTDPSTQRISTGLKVTSSKDPCVPVTDCPVGYVKQSALTSSADTQIATYSTAKTSDPCVVSTERSALTSSTDALPADSEQEKTLAGQALQSVVDTVQESFQSVLELFK